MRYRIARIKCSDKYSKYQIQESFLGICWDWVVGTPTYFKNENDAKKYLKKELEFGCVLGE